MGKQKKYHLKHVICWNWYSAEAKNSEAVKGGIPNAGLSAFFREMKGKGEGRVRGRKSISQKGGKLGSGGSAHVSAAGIFRGQVKE